MGFQHDAILDAFEHVKIDTLGGADYQLEEAYVGDVTSHLLGEH
jgi:ubiquitin-conjugating enzyme (huntingtin interacting protein 2)